MDFTFNAPTSIEYFASLVQSDEHFPLLEAAVTGYREKSGKDLSFAELTWQAITCAFASGFDGSHHFQEADAPSTCAERAANVVRKIGRAHV